MAEIRIVYDNTSTRQDLKPDWGFAALVEARGRTVLFDTGGNGRILLENMNALGIDPKSVDDVFISHGHYDHTGGLSHFLNENGAVTVHTPRSFRGVRSAERVVAYDRPTEIHPGFFTTGELAGIEQSLAVGTGKGLLLVAGCSHPPMDRILSAARVFGSIHGIVGGLHGFDRYDLFEGFGLICPTHCTQHITDLRERFPEAFVSGGAGRVIAV